ncbi:Protein of unknown function [Spirosoma endophyticum]|uniref:Uncharacterized protein n=1 Tax=Spirosoma endophyticum TaxID=662367 RepID=A0A1I1LQH1_9BACT|nr:Protein of unknown function [Spirosoma endophyticum]
MEKCPNCSATLESHFLHYPTCGRTANLPRFRVRHILDEFFQAIFSVDKGVLFLVKNLALQPGVTAREYVVETKRKKYVNPFSYLLLVLGLNLTVNGFDKTIHKESFGYSENRSTDSPSDTQRRSSLLRASATGNPFH